MALETTTNKVIFQGNTVTTVFPYSFIIPLATEVVATFTNSSGTQTVLSDTQYTITGLNDPDGGTFTYPLAGSPMAVGETLTLQRIVPYTQPTVLTNQGGYYPEVVEAADDNIVMQTQQLAEMYGRTIRFPAVDPDANSDGELPAWQVRAGKFQAFDADGNATVSAGSGSDSGLRTDLAASGGSALIGFLQAGTSAVARTVQSKLRDLISVKDFGATGNGVTNDTAALQAALDAAFAAGGAWVCVPRGTYLYTTMLQVKAGCGLIGDGDHSTILSFTPASASIAVRLGVVPAGTINYGMGMHNIGVQLNTDNSTGVHLVGAALGSYQNVSVQSYAVNKGMIGWKIDGSNISSFFNVFDSCVANHCHIGFWHTTTGSTVGTIQVFIGGWANADVGSDATGVCILHDNNCGEDSTYLGTNLESGAIGIKLLGTVRTINFSGVRFEGNTVDMNIAAGCTGNLFTGCIFRSTVTDAGNNNYRGNSGLNDRMMLPLDLSATAAGQIIFPAVANRSLGGNVLDWYDEGMYTATATGMTTSPAGTIKYTIVGDVVTLEFSPISGTSNSGAFTLTGAPAVLFPAATKYFVTRVVDNGGNISFAVGTMGTNGVITLYKDAAMTAFTNSGTKQVQDMSVVYKLL